MWLGLQLAKIYEDERGKICEGFIGFARYLLEEGLNSWLCETPCTGVQRFLLSPDDGLGVRIHVEVLLQLLPREWVQLLDTGDRSVLVAIVGTMLVQCGVDLTRTEDHAVDLCRFVDGFPVFRVRNNPLELRFASEVFYL